jgi:hypothetical protein
VDIEVLEEDYSSEKAPVFPSFAIPKKNGTIRVVTDFRKLNFYLKHDPFPIILREILLHINYRNTQ